MEDAIKNGRNITKWQALKEAWYSNEIAKAPSKFFKWKNVQQKLKRITLDPESLKKVHEDILNTRTFRCFDYPSDSDEDVVVQSILNAYPWSEHIKTDIRWYRMYVYFFIIDVDKQMKALDMAYRLFGKYMQNPESTNIKPTEIHIHLNKIEQLKQISTASRNIIHEE